MPDFGRTPDLDAVARTDRLLDALAASEPASCADPAEEELARLLGGWRDEARWPPTTASVSEATQAEVAETLRRTARLRRRARPGGRRGMPLAGSVAATMLVLGGFGAVVGSAHPGDPLYGLRTTLLGEPQAARDDRIALTAKTELDKVQQMIVEGQWEQAQDRLTTLGDTVQTVTDTHRKHDLVGHWHRLNIQVQKRDPKAVSPPGSVPDPGVVGGAPSGSVTLSIPPPTR
jgi:hypothetical protein